MAGVKKQNTIPLEIAIQKEVALRKKLLTWQVTSSTQSPQQVALALPSPNPPTSNPCLSGTKRKEPEPDDLYCQTCKTPCSSLFNLEQHLMGRKHKSKLKELECSGHKLSNNEGDEGRSKGRKWCGVCKISFMNEEIRNMHLKGHKHRDEMAKFEKSKKEGGGDHGEIANQRQWCEICHIWCIDLCAFNQHLQGKKHVVNEHTWKKRNKNGI